MARKCSICEEELSSQDEGGIRRLDEEDKKFFVPYSHPKCIREWIDRLAVRKRK